MKRLIKTVDLIFFQDDANGEYGLAHKETYNENNAFNAFWSAIGMFHDVFEHAHEHTHKYFKGNYAMNLGGELAAMGSFWYYIDELGISNRFPNDRSRWNPGESMRETTCSDMREAIKDGYCRYGYTLESNVPKQKPVDNCGLEDEMRTYWDTIKDTHFTNDYKGSYDYEQEREFSISYKQSVSFGKIANLHRYGYRMAERMVPNNKENYITLTEFIDFWNNFTKNNNAEELMSMYKGITVKLYKEAGEISWKAFLVGGVDGLPNHEIRHAHNVQEDLLDYAEFDFES
ncbi:MAG: hypothetical protein HC836_34695 [Richelia sp. RM2_1_2]|nr:hypothetical protein [Richelia sp. RM2_1_2]